MEKRWSARESPAKCNVCGKLSHVVASTGSGIPVATVLIVVVFAIGGAAFNEIWLGFLCGLPVAVLYNLRAWQRAEMAPISPEAAAKAGKVSWFIKLLALLGILGS